MMVEYNISFNEFMVSFYSSIWIIHSKYLANGALSEHSVRCSDPGTTNEYDATSAICYLTVQHHVV